MTWLYQGSPVETLPEGFVGDQVNSYVMNYYVYAYLRKDGTPYYIGKGSKVRYKSQDHLVKVPDVTQIVIIEDNLTEVGAFAIERRLIRWYGRKDLGSGMLRNRTDGGEGVSSNTLLGNTNAKGNKGKPKSTAHKKAISDANKGKPKSLEQKQKQSATMKGRKQSPEVVAKRTTATIGNRWWSNGTESVKSRECPGDGWVLGRSSIKKGLK